MNRHERTEKEMLRDSSLPDSAQSKAARALSAGQGLFYLLSGVWPLLHIKSFQKVTGPKTDLWLVKTVGGLVSVIGAVIMAAGLRRRLTPEVGVLAAGSAAGLAAIDLVYVARRRISPVYLLDAVAELTLVGGWLVSWSRDRGNDESPHRH